MSDIRRIQRAIRQFRDERDWMQFHNSKDMALAISIEAAELLELFLWKTDEQVSQYIAQKRNHVENELADIAIYLFELVDNLGIDLEQAIIAKLATNSVKYPVAKAKGSSAKYTELESQ